MPSLVCHWEGRCLDPQTRAELMAYLLELGQCSRRRWEGPEIPRPDFLVIPREQAERRARETEVVRVFDGPITGRIVIEPKLATYEALQTDGSAPAQPIEGPSDWSVHEGKTSCVAYSEAQERWLAFVPPTVDLGGVDFRLYDPRGLYPGEDRVSFLFVRCPQWPALDGKIVAMESHVQCQSYESELVSSADWLLARPSIHLRYYLEEWFDLLLSWVKRYFVDDLYYWRGEEFSQYESISKKMDELSETQGAAAAKQAIFKNLLDRFQEEADQWGESVVRMALEGISLEAVEAEGAEVAGMDVDSGIRCGTCGPPAGPSEHAAGQELSIHGLYEQLHSKRYGEAVDAAKGLVAAGPEWFVLVHRALKDPQLEHLRQDFFLELSSIGDQALPLAKTVVKYLDARTMPAEVTNSAAYALSQMGKEADSSIHAWMEETPAAAWDSWPSLLFHFIGEDRSVEFLRTALRSSIGDRQLWACKMVATDITHPWDALVPTLVEQLPGADEWHRNAAIDAMVAIGQPALETMWDMTGAHRADIRSAGLEALAKYAAPRPEACVGWLNVGDREPLSLLAAMLQDSEPNVRVAAAVALQKVAVAISNASLVAEMEAAEPDVQAAIAKGYQECIVNQSQDRRLRNAIRNRISALAAFPTAARRLAAADLVVSPDAWPYESSQLHAALQDWHEPRRAEYLEAIRHAGPRAKGLMAGIVVCTAADPPVQVAALQALAAMGEHVSEEAVNRAIVCLEDSHLEVRQAAANALGDFGLPQGRETIVALRKALIDDDRGIGREACEALGKMKKLAADAIPEIARRASKLGPVALDALGQIGTQEARAEMLALYQRYAETTDEDEEWIRDGSREWLERWELLPATRDQCDN
jgi:HEAT repeat protein